MSWSHSKVSDWSRQHSIDLFCAEEEGNEVSNTSFHLRLHRSGNRKPGLETSLRKLMSVVIRDGN